MTDTDTRTDTYTYQSAAQAGFGLLYKHFTNGYDNNTDKYTGKTFDGNFWFAGNTLHTCLNYLIATKANQNTPALATVLIRAGRRIYLTLKDESDWWRDDYAWWGNAFAVAFQNRDTFGLAPIQYDDLFNDIRQYMLDCWNNLNGNWRATTYNHKVPGFPGQRSDNAASPVEIPIYGGVFNHAPDTVDGSMSGRNCVTNEGFWILSGHVERYFPTDPGVIERKGQPEEWFDRWLADGTLLDDQGRVLERPTGNASSKGWYWLGDQGLFIDALSAAGFDSYITVIKRIAAAVTKSPILHENMDFVADGLGEYIADYATGKGILMRGLAALNLKISNRPFASFIKKNAAAVWSSRNATTNQFTFNWDSSPPAQGTNIAPLQEPKVLRVNGKSDALCDLIMQAAGQDALNAALSVAAPNEPIRS
jgi:hypothetical protein